MRMQLIGAIKVKGMDKLKKTYQEFSKKPQDDKILANDEGQEEKEKEEEEEEQLLDASKEK